MLSKDRIDQIVYACRQAGDDSTYALARALEAELLSGAGEDAKKVQLERDLAYYKNIAERYTERQLKTAGASGPAGDAEVAGLTLDHDEMHFLAARLRRLFEHFGLPLPDARQNDTRLIGLAAPAIGILLTRWEVGDQQPVAWVNTDELHGKANATIACGADRREGLEYNTPLYLASAERVSSQANLASTLIRSATVNDFLFLADVMAQRLAEYLYDHEDGKGKEAGDAYTAAREALKAALVSGVVEDAAIDAALSTIEGQEGE
jgi:hypothetical protein